MSLQIKNKMLVVETDGKFPIKIDANQLCELLKEENKSILKEYIKKYGNMGQQQCLLIMLGIIVVGIGVCIGITMFSDTVSAMFK